MQGTTVLLTPSIQTLENNTFIYENLTKFLGSGQWPEVTFTNAIFCKKSPFSWCDGRTKPVHLLGEKEIFLSSGYLALVFLTNFKNIWQNNEVSSSKVEINTLAWHLE